MNNIKMFDENDIVFLEEEAVLYCKSGDMKRACSLWHKAAEMGSASAVFNLGTVKLNAASSDDELAEAKKYFETAEGLGHKNAHIQIQKIEKMMRNEISAVNGSDMESRITASEYPVNLFGGMNWLVIAEKEEKKLCLSLSLIDIRRYHEYCEEITWEGCTLRKWLNSEFISTFSEREQDMILISKLKNNDNRIYGAKGGNDTEDKVFLLSLDEIKAYMEVSSDEKCYVDNLQIGRNDYRMISRIDMTDDRVCEAESRYGHKYSLINGTALGWWLRSPGCDGTMAMRVNCNGTVREYGRNITRTLVGVRPAIWIRK